MDQELKVTIIERYCKMYAHCHTISKKVEFFHTKRKKIQWKEIWKIVLFIFIYLNSTFLKILYHGIFH